MTSGNGRFHPEEKYTNDPDKDFPIRDKVHDFAGKEREFEITFHKTGLGYSVQAVELGKDPGYYFRAFDPNSPYEDLPAKLKKENVKPEVLWLFNYKLDFRFR